VASNYTGNPTVLSLIADADGNTAANLYQAWKVLADYCAYDRRQLNAFRYVENNLWGPTSSITSQQNPITGYAPMSAMMSVLVSACRRSSRQPPASNTSVNCSLRMPARPSTGTRSTVPRRHRFSGLARRLQPHGFALTPLLRG
jgi:hypothetical protein